MVASEAESAAVARFLKDAAPTDLPPIMLDCPSCGEPIPLPARLALDYSDEAQVLVSLDVARLHSQAGCDLEKLWPTVLGRFGVPW